MTVAMWSANATPRFSTVFQVVHDYNLLDTRHACTHTSRTNARTHTQSHMVLQRKAPLTIWGFGATSAGHLPLTVTVGKLESAVNITEPGGDEWEATFPAQEASDPSNGLEVVLLQAGQPIQTLVDVCFGDVFLFTGMVRIKQCIYGRLEWIQSDRVPSTVYSISLSSVCDPTNNQQRVHHAGQSNIDISSSYAHQFNETAQELEEAYADAVGSGGLTRIMIVPNQVTT